MSTAIKSLKSGKAPGTDNLHPEFFLNMHPDCLRWLRTLMSTCLHLKKIPKIWRRAILKPNKPAEEPASYRPISLLCIPYKLMERMIYNRLEPIIEKALPDEQAGFRAGRCTLDQVALLTDTIERAFEKKEKVGAVFVDLSAAYDTVWHRGLTLKLLRTVPSKHLVQVIMTMISCRSFRLQLGSSTSKVRYLSNGVPQGSVLAPMLFNIYTADLPNMPSSKFTYADDIAILFSHQEKRDNQIYPPSRPYLTATILPQLEA